MGKVKGSKQTLPMAVRMQLYKEAETRRLLEENTELCMQLYYRAAGVVLNRLFGFGDKKVMEFQHGMNEVMAQVRDEKYGADFEYAFDTLTRAYRQIVKSDIPEED